MESVVDASMNSHMEGQEKPKISTSMLNRILWRNFFKVVKRVWGVFGNYILYTVGIRMGKLVVVEIKKQLRGENLESLVKTLLDLWVQDGLISGYIVKFYEVGIDVFLFNILGERPKKVDSGASFIEGFLEGFVSKIIKKKPYVSLRELGEENAWYRVYFEDYRSFRYPRRDYVKGFRVKPLVEYKRGLKPTESGGD
ncbi:hypothetical protein J7L06_10720 [Candidatus Bathyarchaeota archaeon]|nr:hypothetical protein [Candidatus Bathyarchaeota archaeon]